MQIKTMCKNSVYHYCTNVYMIVYFLEIKEIFFFKLFRIKTM